MATTTASITLTALGRMHPGDLMWDTHLPGFGARCQAKCVSYILKTRIRGRQRWMTIGRHGAPWTPETARKEAKRLLADIATGNDPATAKTLQNASLLLADVGIVFLEQHGSKLRLSTHTEYSRILTKNIMPVLGKRRIDDITKADVGRLHVSMTNTPRHANHVLSVLSKLMNWAEDAGLRPIHSNPCQGIKKYPENKRERYLSPKEMAVLGDVLDQCEVDNSESPYAIAALRLLILTGARLSEILTLKWDYVDIDRKVLFLPTSKTGKKTIKLNQAAIRILTQLPRDVGNPYVIVGHRHGAHLVNLQKPWRRIRVRVGLDDVRIHDLRHSFASMAIANGASLPMVGKLLGHTQAQTTQRYAHLADDPLQQLNEQIGGAIAQAMGGGSSEETGDCTESENHGRIKL